MILDLIHSRKPIKLLFPGKKKQKNALYDYFFCSHRKFCFFNLSLRLCRPFSWRELHKQLWSFHLKENQSLDLLMTTRDFGIQVRVCIFRLNFILEQLVVLITICLLFVNIHQRSVIPRTFNRFNHEETTSAPYRLVKNQAELWFVRGSQRIISRMWDLYSFLR